MFLLFLYVTDTATTNPNGALQDLIRHRRRYEETGALATPIFPNSPFHRRNLTADEQVLHPDRRRIYTRQQFHILQHNQSIAYLNRLNRRVSLPYGP